MKTQNHFLSMFIVLVLMVSGLTLLADPMGTLFTYQGRLLDNNIAADGPYDMQFALFDNPNGPIGSQIGSTVTAEDIDVLDGYFIADLDFGSSAFDGQARWLQIIVRPGESTNSEDFEPLSPLQKLTPTPYALYALNGPGSSGFWSVNGNDIYNTNNGNVGIGTTGPDYPLEVHNNGTTGQILRLQSDKTLGYVQFREGSTTRAYLGYGDAGNILTNAIADSFAIDGVSTALHFAVDSDATKGITIDTDGQVGIGTTGPAEKLDVRAGTSPGEPFAAAGQWTIFGSGGTGQHGILGQTAESGWGGVFYNSNSDIEVDIAGPTYGLIVKSGDVGIGTASPDAKLDVRGDLHVTGAYKGDIGPNDGAPFPRPAYDSGWVDIPKPGINLTHNLGGNVDNYVVDLWFKYDVPGGMRHQQGFGGRLWDDSDGAYWDGLTMTSIGVRRMPADTVVGQARVRIWVYK